MPTNEEWDALLRAVNESRSPLDWNAIRCAILHAKEANTLKADNSRLAAECESERRVPEETVAAFKALSQNAPAQQDDDDDSAPF